MERKNLWETYNEAELNELESISKTYRDYLNKGKTERECITEAVRMAEEKGYKDLCEVLKDRTKLHADDKVYVNYMGKSMVLYHIGQEPIENGMNILGAHVDSPRIDIKQMPVYEEGGFSYLDTHYYGGIKKYQWLSQPLAIHGVVVKKDGTKVEIVIGEGEDEPVLVITDLLIHLAKEQLGKKVSEIIPAENMDLLIGNKPLAGEKKEKIKKGMLALIKETYDIEEEDFMSAELEIVPAGKARDCGIDRSMIMAYGQDDRSCAYTSLHAMLELENPKKTACCVLVDKEEIGSVGATGMNSRFFENATADLIDCIRDESCGTGMVLRHCLANSKMLSSDVSAAYDPMFDSVFEKKNSAYFANGVVFNKYTGSGGKSGSNDANAEYVAEIRAVMDQGKVSFQTAELGRVDVGGGGTIAYILAAYGMNVIDCGIPVLCMHAPWEVTSKVDIYEAVKAYRAFLSYM